MEHLIPLAAGGLVIVAGILLLRGKKKRVGVLGQLKPQQVPAEACVVDPREKVLESSAETVRTVLSSLIDIMRNADNAADNSTVALNAARTRINNVKASSGFSEADALLDEIDRVISSNSKLRAELASSQDNLKEQEEQIGRLQTAVRVDRLTQLGNRAAFEEALEQAMDRFSRYQEHFCLAMFDLDHFKRINDTFGHPAGDRVLKGLALKFKATLRSSDFIGRYGGEEFVAILLRSSLEEAADIAEHVREAVASLRMKLDSEQVRITISAGVTAVIDGDTAERLIERADGALYDAKQTGRNRVCMA